MNAHMHYRLKAIEEQLKEIDQGKAEYRTNHKLAKAIVCAAIAFALYLDGASLVVILTIPAWFFFVNTVAYGIESLRGHKHKHEVL